MTRLDLTEEEFDPYYERYLSKLPENTSLYEGFESGKSNVLDFFENLPIEKLDYRYAPGKWSIKEILQHLVDTERIFMYRCFRIARRDTTSLAGFDQNVYVQPSRAATKSFESLLNEFKSVRDNSISLLTSLTEEDLRFIGVANEGAMSARAAAFSIIGHEIWHMDLIKERYL